jgi:hypothetical protein
MYLSIPLLLTSYDTISGDGSDDEHCQSQQRSNNDDPAGVIAGQDNDINDMDVDLPSNHIGISPLVYIHIILQLA